MNPTQQNQKSDPASQMGQGGQVNSSGRNNSATGQGVSTAQGREVSAGASQNAQPERAESAVILVPPVDIFEDEGGLTVIADMPGVAKEQLGVRVTGDNLVIEGMASVPVTGSMELVYGEIQSPQYRRSFTLSRELDSSKIEAKLDKGVLRLRIPKAEQAKPRRIEVTVG
ncbi:MAG: heat shock protein Hsp20 [Polaromonas sp.]|nr:heat shock protein Hsp20 [Polaromonas sp.]